MEEKLGLYSHEFSKTMFSWAFARGVSPNHPIAASISNCFVRTKYQRQSMF